MATATSPPDEREEYVFRPFITLKNGQRIFAKDYGKKAFKIRVKK